MKTLHKTILISVLLATPFTMAQARETMSQHEAWIQAQKIDIQPTLKVTETKIPADSAAGSTNTTGTTDTTGTTGTTNPMNTTESPNSTGSMGAGGVPQGQMPPSQPGAAIPYGGQTPSMRMPNSDAPSRGHPAMPGMGK